MTTVEELEAIVGRPSPLVLGKQLAALDDGCVRVVTASPLAGFGFLDAGGRPRTTFLGGEPGFVRVDSPTRISVPLDGAAPVPGSGVSFVFLLPGIGETLRLNGRARGGRRIDVEEVYVHCARCVLRSGLWDAVPATPAAPAGGAAGTPLADPAIAAFLAAAPFAVVSTWDAAGSSDTSPRGDPPGFLRVRDGRTLVIPDRKGNRRADTFHNLLSDDRISLAAVIPGRAEVLQLRGAGRMTHDPDLLRESALNGRPPHAALLIDVEHAEVVGNPALRRSRAWDPAARADVPDLTALATRQLAAGRATGVPRVLRLLLRPMAAFPRLTRRLIDLGYRRQLTTEGYAGKPRRRRR
jgi:predicted pyridoxine 5'-phosphate oxidase superfamily flavin-nucleotide-binding protein